MTSKSSQASTGLHSRTLQELLTGASDPEWQIKLKLHEGDPSVFMRG